MKNKKAYFITQAAVIAALYVVLTLFINAFDLASGAIQVRISEALTILPYFTPAAVPGLFIGCLLSNFMTGAAIWDIIFGSLATLIGAIGTYLLRKWKWCAPLPPILSNTIITESETGRCKMRGCHYQLCTPGKWLYNKEELFKN